MKTRLLLFFLGILSLYLMSCSPKTSEMIVAEFGDYDITLPEFEEAYAKNVGGYENAADDSLKELDRFLDLYVNFRMKLRDAVVRNYPNDPEILNELNTYKKQVGASFITEREILEPGLKEFYDQRAIELRVSHIMFRFKQNEDEVKAQAQKILDSVLAGGNFAEFALKYSEDNFSKVKGGDVFWITAGQIIKEFEDAAYSVKVGEVYPGLVKTRFGYHIIKVTDSQPRRYEIRASHILIRHNPEIDSSDSESPYNKIVSLRERILNGEDFAELAKEYSDDKNSGVNGGDLGFFPRRKMVLPFDTVAFSLNVGEISEPVETRFGWHLIKVTDEKEYPSFEVEKESLREQYTKTRFDDDKKEYISNLKEIYSYSFDDNMMSFIANYKDTIRTDDSYWDSNLHNDFGERSVFKINNHSFTVDSLFAYAISQRNYKNKIVDNSNNLRDVLNKYADQKLLEEKATTLDETDDEFASLMQDYKNGIYIFKLQEEEVWNRLKVDTNEVKKFYERTKENYTLTDRVSYSEILVKDDSTANAIYDQISGGADFNRLAKQYTSRAGFKMKEGFHGIQEIDKDALSKVANSLEKLGDVAKPFKTMKGWSIVKLVEKYPARLKTYEEAKAEAASAYQDMMSKKLEQDYLDRLNKLYEPEVYDEVLQHAFK